MPQFERFHQIQLNGNEKIRLARVYYGTVLLSTGGYHTGLCLEITKGDGRPHTTAISSVDAVAIANILLAGADYADRHEAELSAAVNRLAGGTNEPQRS